MSKKKKKGQVIVFLDVDDVLVNFLSLFNKQISQMSKVKVKSSYVPKNLGWTELLSSLAFERIMDSLQDSWPSETKCFKGAAAFTKRLRKLGARVIIITSILPKSAPYRLEQLLDEGVEFDEAYFTRGSEKGAFARQLVRRFRKKGSPRAILVDDMMRNCIEFTENVPNSIAFTLSYPYNDSAISGMTQRGQTLPISYAKSPAALYKQVANFVKKM